MDTFLVLALGLSVGLFVTCHVALSGALRRSGLGLRSWVALFVPPLAPYWGWRAGLRWLPAFWVFLLGTYLLLWLPATRG